MSDAEFLPCPFCGESCDDISYEGDSFVATCPSCITEDGWVTRKDWQRRMPTERLAHFASEIHRLCTKYIAFYEEQSMTNTADAFREMDEFAIAAMNHE